MIRFALRNTRPPLFLDLDGPLLDVRARYHGVYANIAVELGVDPLPPEPYWQAKRRRAPIHIFFPGAEAEPPMREAYRSRWLPRIEAPEWLALDFPSFGARECLETLAGSFSLHLVTLRRDPRALHDQLHALDLQRHFAGIHSGWVLGGGGAALKASWMRPLPLTPETAIVGDTEIDMGAARLLGIRAIGVSFGIREPDALMSAGAEAVIDHLSAIPDLLKRQPG